MAPTRSSRPSAKVAWGEVYRARETRLDRDVALEVLPLAFVRDRDRLTRFEREAKLLASLNHPSIATIYGIEESDGLRALVLELIDGGTLADRIAAAKGGARGLINDEIVALARPMADALDAALWVYYIVEGEGFCIEKIPASGGSRVVVRADGNSHAPALGQGVLYFAARAAPEFGTWNWEIRRASPEDGPSELVGRVAPSRLAVSPVYVHLALSRDGQWLAHGLADGATTNIWLLSTTDGSWRQVTDFGEQPTIIARPGPPTVSISMRPSAG